MGNSISTVHLIRFAYTTEGTWGLVKLPDGSVLYTVERPWVNNEPFVSCIPDGSYRCVPGFYNRGGYACHELVDVPGRSLIKIHRANWPHELAGCIAPVVGLLRDRWPWMGTSSRMAHDRYMESLSEKEFELVIAPLVARVVLS